MPEAMEFYYTTIVGRLDTSGLAILANHNGAVHMNLKDLNAQHPVFDKLFYQLSRFGRDSLVSLVVVLCVYPWH